MTNALFDRALRIVILVLAVCMIVSVVSVPPLPEPILPSDPVEMVQGDSQ